MNLYMKIPEVVFVKHCPLLAPERKKFLEKHLQERCVGKEIHWLEDYNHDDLFVQWLNAKMKLPYGPKLTSNFVKSLFALKKMVDEDIECALHMDDDVVFHRDWEKFLKTAPEEIERNGFVNLGTSPFFNLQPKIRQVYQLPNNGGCEAAWISKEFARDFLNNLNLNEAPDIVIHGFLNSTGRPILNIPVAHQTSSIERASTVDHDTRRPSNWIEYVQNYVSLPKTPMIQLLQEFTKFRERKERVDKKFTELYGKEIDIKNVKYILNDDHDNRLNILEFNLIENKMDV